MQALTNAMVRALKWLQKAGPSDLIKMVPENFLLGDRALYSTPSASDAKRSRPTAASRRPARRRRCSTLQAFEPDLRGKKIDLSKTFTNDFVKKANAKYK